MASIREELTQDCIGWGEYVLSLADDRIIKGFDHDSGMPRPEKPYITFFISNYGTPIGWDEVRRRDNSGSGEFQIFGSRSGQLQVDGYGKDATELVGSLHRSLKRPDVRHWLKSNGPLGLTKDGPIEDTTQLLANDQERRVTAQFRVTYAFESEWFSANSGIAQSLKLKGNSKLVDPTSVSDLSISKTLP